MTTESVGVEVTKSQIDVADTGQMYHTLDIHGEVKELGELIYRDYLDGKDVRAAFLRPVAADSGVQPKDVRLGIASAKWKPWQHTDVVEPVMSQGFLMSGNLLAHYGKNTELFATFYHPDYKTPDFIGWDTRQLTLDPNVTMLYLALQVRTSLKVGAGVSIQAGYFRVVCSNGLVVWGLQMGGEKWSQKAFAPDKAFEFVGSMLKKYEDDFSYSGAPISTNSLRYPYELLGHLVRQDSIEGYEFDSPRFLDSAIRRLEAIPGWRKIMLQEQINHLMAQDEMTELDIVNAITNTADSHPSRQARQMQVYRNLDSTFDAVMDTIDAGAFRAGVEGFGK